MLGLLGAACGSHPPPPPLNASSLPRFVRLAADACPQPKREGPALCCPATQMHLVLPRHSMHRVLPHRPRRRRGGFCGGHGMAGGTAQPWPVSLCWPACRRAARFACRAWAAVGHPWCSGAVRPHRSGGADGWVFAACDWACPSIRALACLAHLELNCDGDAAAMLQVSSCPEPAGGRSTTSNSCCHASFLAPKTCGHLLSSAPHAHLPPVPQAARSAPGAACAPRSTPTLLRSWAAPCARITADDDVQGLAHCRWTH